MPATTLTKHRHDTGKVAPDKKEDLFMDILICLIGLFGMPVCILILLIKLIRKKSKKKTALAFAVCFVMFIGGGVWAANKPTEDISQTNNNKTEKPVKTDYKKLDKYEWGDAAKEVFAIIGIEKVKSVEVQQDEETGTIYDVYVETELGTVNLYPTKNVDGWEILWVSNHTVYDSLAFGDDFYVADSLKYDDKGNIIKDIYSYKTGELLEAKNEEAIKAAEEEKRKQQEEYENTPGNTSKKPIVVTINKFVNEIVEDIEAAKEKYNGKWIQITGTVKDISDAGDMIGYYIYGAKGVPGLKITCWVYNEKLVANIDQEVTFKGIVREVSTVNNTEIGECTLVQ